MESIWVIFVFYADRFFRIEELTQRRSMKRKAFIVNVCLFDAKILLDRFFSNTLLLVYAMDL